MSTSILSIVTQITLLIHLLIFAFVLVSVLKEDYTLITSNKINIVELQNTAKLTSLSLFVLWLTGAFLLYLKPGLDLQGIIDSPKLATKVTVVTLLTINGLIMHLVAFPKILNPSANTSCSASLVCVLGVISSVSWVYASFVGAARVVASMMTYELFLALYLAPLISGIVFALIVVRPHLQKLLAQRHKLLLTQSNFTY